MTLLMLTERIICNNCKRYHLMSKHQSLHLGPICVVAQSVMGLMLQVRSDGHSAPLPLAVCGGQGEHGLEAYELHFLESPDICIFLY
jgi:hypothetical protein